ncbi:hypothetical protein GCM10010404_58710 [Nonomuraea africana]|uniref:Uncharacterized protein n=1 Tax=Nonomuraea africana TaxID=46171 RepID=A0ABR9KBA2_9ACTN|nr:hypothetical protein [Nonomuraea africana]MBE1559003.1 hypothetical protein [Nonomuraea africana]
MRGMLRTFLTTKQVTDQGCTGENYHAIGAFPQQVKDVPPYPARKQRRRERDLVRQLERLTGKRVTLDQSNQHPAA